MATRGYVDASGYSDALGCAFWFENNSYVVKGFRLSADCSGTTGLHDISAAATLGATGITGGEGNTLFESVDSTNTYLHASNGKNNSTASTAMPSGGSSGSVWNGTFWTPAVEGALEYEFPGGYPCPAGTVFQFWAVGSTGYAGGDSPTPISPAYYCHLYFDVEVV